MFPKGRSSALVYGLNYKARALDAQQKTQRNCFLIGTLTLSEQNQARPLSSSLTHLLEPSRAYYLSSASASL